MSTVPAAVTLGRGGLTSGLRGLTLPGARLVVARLLVIFSFVWPFFNYTLIDPNSLTEVNFVPVLAAALLLPEVAWRERCSILLSLPVFLVALLWANSTAPLRLAFGIIPCISYSISPAACASGERI